MYFTNGGHQQYIEKIGCAGTAQMGMAETHDGCVADVITRAVVPVADSVVRAQLHHSKRHCRAGIGVSMTAGTDKHIDPLIETSVGRHSIVICREVWINRQCQSGNCS